MLNEITALSQTEYRLKITFKATPPFFYYAVANPYQGLRLAYAKELDNPKDGDISIMTKPEWKKLLSRVESLCSTEAKLFGCKYKISYEQAFSYNDVVILYFEPSKLPGTLNLAQLKKKLKSAGIPVVSVEQDKQYHKYGGATKYYRFYILKKYKGKVDSFIKHASDNANISYEPPSY